MERFKGFLRTLGRGIAEFFNPRYWVPEIPIVRKPHPDAKGYQSLGDAIRGFPKDER